MASKIQTVRSKIRTRQHIIADLSFNHLERYVLECGHVVEPVFHDYGYDAIMFTYSETGDLQPGQILFQLKATDSPKIRAGIRCISCLVDRRDLKVWLREHEPVILIVYDASRDYAYWINVQEYFGAISSKQLFSKSATISVRIPLTSRVNHRAIRKIVADRVASFH